MPLDLLFHARAILTREGKRRNPDGVLVLSVRMDIDYRALPEDLETGLYRSRLRSELAAGFERMEAEGERLPPASYYATKIVEVIHTGAPVPLTKEISFDLYQETLLACEEARADVLGEDVPPPFDPLAPGR